MANSKVPKFGAWDQGEEVAYTTYFDNARKSKAPGAITNPNDPQMNRDIPARAARPDQKPTGSLSRQENTSNGSSKDQLGNQRTGGRGSSDNRQRSNGVSDYSFEKSPAHPRTPARGGSGPPSYDSANGGQGRSRPKRGSQTPDRGPSVPEFGEWNKNPAQAEGYTHVFDVMRQERMGGATPENANQPSYNRSTPGHHTNDEPKEGRCCPWF